MPEFRKIEEKWQKRWEKAKLFESDPDPKKKKFFVNNVIPYTNGEPHIGAGFTYLRGDTFARFKRMQGFNVLYPQGFHATGEPILGIVERLRDGDKDQIEALKNFGATDRDIKNFMEKGPEFVARYWMEKWIEVLKSAGYSADWRRTFITAIDEKFNRFIQWQYRTLKKKGYVVQGTHPVVWCPRDQSPTGDHDRLVGEGESPLEYVMIKFELDSGEILPCGTLRPETVYGATNIWINPEGKYVRAEINGSDWIVGKRAAEKLKDQLYKVKIKEEVEGKSLIGKAAKNPVTKSSIPILPASFVDSEVATGIVMSVPSHAPYDWIGLQDLKKNPGEVEKFGIRRELVEKILPISIISVEGMSEHPAVEVAGKLLISSQSEKEKLDEATDIVYKKEFHQGVLRENTGYPGTKVSEVKERLIGDFVRKGFASIFWETTGEVVCRCKTKCHVKILENQWFLRFSDEKWKRLVKEAMSRMSFYPEIARSQFTNTVDWLKDKACARKSGLGTKLPWDEEWIVETLSDSTIYMAYYTIAHLLRKVPAGKLTDEIFDYVFLGKGTAKSAAKKSKLNSKILERMRKQFEHFYPVDLRLSAKELIQNHLTYFLFHHTAIWEDPSMWPRGISVNGFVTLGGQKMAKRFGNVRRLRELIEKYGADVTRLNLVGSNENMDDADWRDEGVDSFASRIKFLWDLSNEMKNSKRLTHQNADKFILSRMQKIVEQTTDACELTKFRTALQSAFFEATNEIRWYIDRCNGVKNCNGKVLKEVLSTLIRLLSPFMPHIAEEIWESLGNRDFVSTADWPRPNKKMSDEKSELGEGFIRRVLEDARQIQKISGIVPRKITVIVSPQWKFDLYRTVLENEGKDFKQLLGKVKVKNEDVVKYLQQLQRRTDLPESFLERQAQFDILGEARNFLEKQLAARVVIEDAEKSKIEKARNADVHKPAMLLI